MFIIRGALGNVHMIYRPECQYPFKDHGHALSWE